MHKNEAKLVKKCIEYAKKQGFLAHKLTYRSSAGAPDCLFISRSGALLFVEFKRPAAKHERAGVLSELQKIMSAKYAMRGITIYVCDNFDYFCNLLGELQ